MKTTMFTTFGLALVLGLSSSIAAQRLRVEIPSGQTTTGTTSDNATSKVGVTVGGIGTTVVPVPKGASSKDVVDALVDRMSKDGYKVTRDGDHGFFIDEGPKGQKVDKGGGIGSDDSGIKSVKSSIEKGAKAGAKQNGGQVPLPAPKQANAVASKAGRIQVDVEVERIENGKPVRTVVQVVVPVEVGDSAADIEKRARATLEKSGLQPRDVTVPSNLDGKTMKRCVGIDRSATGDPVHSLRFEAELPPEFIFEVESWGGTTPILGLTDEGRGSMPRMPWFYGSDPFLGQPLQLFVEVGPPNVIGGLFLGGQRFELPIPAFGPDAWLFVDPFASLFLPLPLPQNGSMGLQLPLPPDPTLQGADLFFQAIVLDVQQVVFATTNRVVVHPMQPRR
ncbi:MAG TPA: hypothetical protein PKE00_03310 [Planctomycetota bacterium]|nr:hypothetical protein [Planctomycetota bacterium]